MDIIDILIQTLKIRYPQYIFMKEIITTITEYTGQETLLTDIYL